MSNYYPPRVSYTTSSTGRSATSGDAAATSGAIASIRTNPDYYYNHSPPASASGVSSSRSQFYYGPSSPPPKTSSSSVKLKMSEYVRGPFGIYTRAAAANHHDHSSSSASSNQLPPSSSSMSFVASRIGNNRLLILFNRCYQVLMSRTLLYSYILIFVLYYLFPSLFIICFQNFFEAYSD